MALPPTSVVIVEDQRMLAEIFELKLKEMGFLIAGTASDGRAAIETILHLQPTLVLLDLGLPIVDGFAVIKAIRQAGCHPRVLIISSFLDFYTVYLVDHLHVHGYLDKGLQGLPSFTKAVTQVATGAPYFSDSFLRKKQELRDDPKAFNKLLTDHEIEVAVLIAEGMDDHEIADVLDFSDGTAKKHRFNITRKLGLNTRRAFREYCDFIGFRRSLASRAPEAQK